ncbi:LysR family transcriptional regulator [Novosphingobium capsulatum]|uniref:LysR family transcriptional regulator n=1 Tax=Novosphingobium capsulatum TaxID=13688 RepID=UPI00078691FB|nr:LysR family transcriptional regulator [Novosphingobium capsulatum]WQD95004.1 LysR family transcriptional regulator [Novosphingobium capsulatum]
MIALDLNLLRVFDALMETRSVTRAARQLGLTQPAVSHALARLRRVMDDPLFLRQQSGLQPTARAEEIAGGVRRGLAQFQAALAPTAFEPARADRTFTLAASPYFCHLMVPALVAHVRQVAPGVSLRIVPSGEAVVTLLDHGTADLALGAAMSLPERIVVEPFYEEQMVWIAAPDNPVVTQRLPLAAIDPAARITITPGGPAPLPGFPAGIGATAQADLGDWRTTPTVPSRITVYESQTAVALVARTDLVARVSARIAAPAVARGDVVVLDGVDEEVRIPIALIWHARQRADQGLAWLRATIRAL